MVLVTGGSIAAAGDHEEPARRALQTAIKSTAPTRRSRHGLHRGQPRPKSLCTQALMALRYHDGGALDLGRISSLR